MHASCGTFLRVVVLALCWPSSCQFLMICLEFSGNVGVGIPQGIVFPCAYHPLLAGLNFTGNDDTV